MIRRALSDVLTEDPDDGWASHTMRRTLRRALLLAVCLWQVVMLWAVASTPGSVLDKGLLGAAHLSLSLLALLARGGRFPAGLLLVLVYPVALCDWAFTDSIEGVLAFSGCWLVHLNAAAATILRRHWGIALPTVAALVVPVGIYAINPGWGPAMPTAVGVTTLSVMVATRLGMPFLVDFATHADAEAAAMEAEVRRTAASRTASYEAAEDARTLHDTVINTLSAIANGGAGTTDLRAVRERCARDAATVEDLQAAGEERLDSDTRLRAIFEQPAITIRRTGIEDQELREVERELSGPVTQMILRAVREVLQNARKHAHVEHVEVDVQVDGTELVIVVGDDGPGFDGHLPADRGFATSVLSRAREADVVVELDTAPGIGTTVTFRKQLGEPQASGIAETVDQADSDAGEIVLAMWMRAGWLWAIGVTFVGIMIEPLNRFGQLTEVYLMLVVLTLVTAFAWFTRDSGGRLRRSAVILLAAGASVAFVLSAAAVDFGRHDVVFWQAVAPSAPLVLLIASDAGRWTIRASIALFTATVAAITVVVWQDSSGAASIIPVGGIVTLGLVVGWSGFQVAVARLGARASEDHHTAVRARLDMAVRIAADDARKRWRVAGLHQSIDLLRGVAEGSVDPSAASTRASCAREEAYLRQLTQLNPELVHMGEWFARALHDGRTREGRLEVRTGEVDAPDEQTAASLGAVLLSAVSSMPRGALLSATIFPSSNDLRMTLVSPHPHLAQVRQAWRPTRASTMTYQTIESQDLVEIVVRVGGQE